MYEEIRIRNVDPSELIDEQTAIRNALLGPSERPEPYRTQYIAYERLKNVFRKEHLASSPLVADSPKGKGLIWRWWPQSAGIVLIMSTHNDGTCHIENKVTFVDPKEITLDLTKVVTSPPDWGRSRG
jgi:hypothetical protein